MRLTITSITILKLNQIKSNVAFWRLGKTGVSGEKPIGSEKGTNILSPLMTPSIGGRRALTPKKDYSYASG